MIAKASVQIGIEKIRVTGGEPLVRNGVIDLLKSLSKISGLRQLVLTTNGILLKDMAEDLRNAGVQRLNISLDSLKKNTFMQITRCGDVEKVLDGIEVANKLGFPIKINVVAMRGINDNEFVDFASLTLGKPYAVRFIEYMPTAKDNDWQSLVISGEEILEKIRKQYRLNPVASKNTLSGPSQDFKIEGSLGTVGIITPISGHFCRECNRIRVTSSGTARSCLFDDHEYDLKPMLKSGDMASLKEMLHSIVMNKPKQHGITNKGSVHDPFNMSKVGG
jgi:cyclic pyranopterin phosphate synthase